MTNNTLKDSILDLFPDNNNHEITAEDMRIYVGAIFDNKEELVIKIPNEASIPANNTKIFEASLVIVYDDHGKTGLYVSKVNQPSTLSEMIKISSLDFDDNYRVIFTDGINDMDAGYTPQNPLSVATKEYVDNLPKPTQLTERFLLNGIDIGNNYIPLLHLPINTEHIFVFHNGLLMDIDAHGDVFISSNTVQFLMHVEINDKIIVKYSY